MRRVIGQWTICERLKVVHGWPIVVREWLLVVPGLGTLRGNNAHPGSGAACVMVAGSGMHDVWCTCLQYGVRAGFQLLAGAESGLRLRRRLGSLL